MQLFCRKVLGQTLLGVKVMENPFLKTTSTQLPVTPFFDNKKSNNTTEKRPPLESLLHKVWKYISSKYPKQGDVNLG